jgi:3-methyladenine DNA glycosylase AlkD
VRDDLRSIVDALYATEYFDLRSVGLLLLEKHRAKLEVRDLPWLIDLVRRSSNWGHVDLLAAKVIGHVVRRAPDADAILQKWAKDESLWVRRTALLAGLDELRAGGGDFDRFERLAAPLVGEKEFFIRKAIGWVLREVSKKRPALSYRFLARHRDEVSGLTLREGAKYLPRAMRGRLGLG